MSYWYETAGFRTELSKLDCDRVSDILQMFRILTYSIKDLVDAGARVDPQLSARREFRGFDHNDALEGHMASYVRFLMRDDRWTELKPQLQRHDDGNSHGPALDTYLRMLAEYRRIKDSRERGFGRSGYLLTLEELERVAAARVHPSLGARAGSEDGEGGDCICLRVMGPVVRRVHPRWPLGWRS